MNSRNEELMKSFSDYCMKHPEQRFWQALRNWAREEVDGDINFIMVAPIEYMTTVMDGDLDHATNLLQDTFNW